MRLHGTALEWRCLLAHLVSCSAPDRHMIMVVRSSSATLVLPQHARCCRSHLGCLLIAATLGDCNCGESLLLLLSRLLCACCCAVLAPQHVCREDVLRARHWRPVPLRAQHPPLRAQQGSGRYEGGPGATLPLGGGAGLGRCCAWIAVTCSVDDFRGALGAAGCHAMMLQ
jgi:hypothetical protein